MRSIRKPVLIAAACAAAVALAVSWHGASAQTTPPGGLTVTPILVDRVVATVEDRAILQSDVDEELRQILLQSQRTSLEPDEEKRLRAEILDALINNQLMAIQAEKDGITVDDKEVDDAVDRTIDENKRDLGGDEGFNKQLAADGITVEQLRTIYREKWRLRLLVRKLVYEKLAPEVEVRDSDVREYYTAHLSELQKRPATVTFEHIIMVPQPSDSVRERMLKKTEMIEKKIREGGDFAALAGQYSDCPSAKFGGDLGFVRLEDLNNPAFADAARKLTVGQVSSPVLTEFGYHIIRIEGVEGDKVHVRHILVKVEPSSRDLEQTAALAEKVRSEIVAGADFRKMAALYSADYNAKDSTSVGNEVAVANLPETFQEIIKDVAVGDVAPVIKDARGFVVMKILNRSAERPFTFDEAKEDLRRIVEDQKLQERVASYVAEIRKQYSVEIKGA